MSIKIFQVNELQKYIVMIDMTLLVRTKSISNFFISFYSAKQFSLHVVFMSIKSFTYKVRIFNCIQKLHLYTPWNL